MKRYDSYKDSGVEWIREIPKEWRTNRLKWISQIENSGVWGEDDEFPNSVNVPIPTTGQLSIDGEWYYDKMNLRNLSNDEWNKYKCIEGDIVVVKSSGSSTNIITGKCGFISEEDSEKFGFSNFLMRVRPNKMIPKLVYYFLSSNLTKQRIERMVSSTTYPNLKVDEYSNSELLIPPISEQQQIVSFLDNKTSLIDSLIEKTQRKIELLKEKRTSLINEVVTKGLNPNVEMKDSGVEWIGEIPSHWDKTKTKYQFDISGGGTPSKDNSEYWNGDIPWVSPKDMKLKYISKTEDYVTIEGINNSSTKLISKKSLLMVVRSGILQHTIPVCFNSVPVTINQDLKSFEEKRQMTCSYFYYLIKGHEKNLLLEWSKEGTTVESIEMDFMMNSELPLPSILEQQQIVEYLDEQTQLIDKTISIEEKRIELLKEYRQSLISEVVTGKRKVVE